MPTYGVKPASGPLTKEKAAEVLEHCNKPRPRFGCRTCSTKDLDCDQLAEKINNLAFGKKGLENRFADQNRGAEDWFKGEYNGYCPPYTQNYTNHNDHISDDQSSLKRRMAQHKAKKCDESKLKKGAKEMAERRIPYHSRGQGMLRRIFRSGAGRGLE